MQPTIAHISIHALREEGDVLTSIKDNHPRIFLSTPSSRRATGWLLGRPVSSRISIHALREEGDADLPPDHDHRTISIHALREEGDLSLSEARDQVRLISIHALREEGDLASLSKSAKAVGFLSTPSARRATRSKSCCSCSTAYFYPRPPRGGRRPRPKVRIRRPSHFYPRPPRGGRHLRQHVRSGIHPISIHALREEGDPLPGLR